MPDTALHPYRFSQRGRRPLVWLLLGIGLALLALALAVPAPPAVLPPLGLYLALVLYALLRDPERGMSITAQEVRFWGRGMTRRFAIAAISHVGFGPGPGTVTLHLRDGTAWALPVQHLPTPEVLRHEFRRAGIAVRDSA